MDRLSLTASMSLVCLIWGAAALADAAPAADTSLTPVAMTGSTTEVDTEAAIAAIQQGMETKAAQGDPAAMVCLAETYYRGILETPDRAKAINLLREAVDKGSAQAKVHLANIYYSDAGFDRGALTRMLPEIRKLAAAHDAGAESL